VDFLNTRSGIAERLRTSHEALAALLAGIGDAGYERKPESGWSIAENVEHLIVVEGRVLAGVKRMIAKGAGGPANPLSDETVWRRAVGETGKGEAPAVVAPSGQWPNRSAAMAELAARRQATIEYALTTQDPLRACAIPMPLGEIDGYQCLIMLAGHLERHTRQIQALL
jgi:hypothetical protein